MSPRSLRPIWILLLAWPAVAAAAEQPSRADEKPRLAYRDDRDLAAWHTELRAELRKILAVPELPGAKVPWTAKRVFTSADHTIDRIEFTAEPGQQVPGYLLRPTAVKPPYRVMICLQGHSPGVHVSIGRKDPERLDERIRLVVDSCSFCTYADSWLAVRHCPCGYVPGMLPVADMPDLAGLIAPRGLLIVAGRNDPLARLSGVQNGFNTARRIYRDAGAPNQVRLVIGPDGHRFHAADAWPLINDLAAQWK